jgi:hypothetical protein
MKFFFHGAEHNPSKIPCLGCDFVNWTGEPDRI